LGKYYILGVVLLKDKFIESLRLKVSMTLASEVSLLEPILQTERKKKREGEGEREREYVYIDKIYAHCSIVFN
jgi:hypothetical protein